MTDLAIRDDAALTTIEEAINVLGDPDTPLADRLAVYAVLHQWQLRVNRRMRAVKDDLIVAMERSGEREIGPVAIKSSAVDPSWPCNDPDNHDDSGVQDAMAALFAAPATRPFVRHVIEHYEIVPKALADAMQNGDPTARDLYTECNRRGWRREEARRLSLAVREPKKGKAAA